MRTPTFHVGTFGIRRMAEPATSVPNAPAATEGTLLQLEKNQAISMEIQRLKAAGELEEGDHKRWRFTRIKSKPKEGEVRPPPLETSTSPSGDSGGSLRRTRRPPAGPNTSAPVRPSFGRTTEICVPSWWASLATRSPLSSSISSPPSRRLEGARPRRPSRALRCCSVGGRGDSAGAAQETTRARTGGFRGPAGARRCSASLRGGVCSRTADQGGGARGALARSLSPLSARLLS